MKNSFEKYQSLLDESASLLRGEASCPVPLRPICRELGVHGVRRDRLDRAKSLLIDAEARPVIILNTSVGGTGTGTARFTRLERFLIAHELGHLVLHQRGVKGPSGQNEYWKVEKLCDAFARRLLIPEHVVASVADQTKPTALERLRASLRVASECRVHWSAAAARVAELTNDIVFFRFAEVPFVGFKIIVSTHAAKQGIGQLIKPTSLLYDTLQGCRKGTDGPCEIAADALVGIGGIAGVLSGAVWADRVAVMPT